MSKRRTGAFGSLNSDQLIVAHRFRIFGEFFFGGEPVYEHSPSRHAADRVSNSFAIWNLIAYANFEVETNVPGGAVPPLTSLLGEDRALRAR